MSQLNQKTSTGLRMAQIVLGAIAIILSITMFVYPGVGAGTLVFLLTFALLAAGFERIIVGIFPHHTKSSRLGNIVLGLIAIGLGIAVAVYPVGTTYFLVALLAVGLLFLGIARIIQGFANSHAPGWSRGASIGVGILCLIISGIVFVSPLSGVVFLSFMLGIALLVIGIESVINGVSGRGNVFTSSSTMGYGK